LARRNERRVRWGLPTLCAALVVYGASGRYALVVTPVSTVSVGIMNGAATFHVRDDTVKGARTNPLGTGDQKRVSLYRHRYSWAWRVKGWPEFRGWARGERPPAAPAAMSPVAVRAGRVVLGTEPRTTLCRLEVPLWIPIGGFAAGYLVLAARRWRRRPWQCAGCGYDLREVTGAACPECGLVRERSGHAVGAKA
jgi:hypothetical protein